MTVDTYSILIVEDNPADARLYDEMLKESVLYTFNTVAVTQLSDALIKVEAQDFSVALLDLSLPDSDGIETLTKFTFFAPHIPVIVATGQDDLNLGVNAMQHGADDFMLKSELAPNSLGRALVYTAERRRLLQEVEQARKREQRELEIAALTQLSDSSTSKVTARSLAIESFHTAAPTQFDRVVELYVGIIPDALEERKLKVDYQVSERLKEIAELLGGWRCGPRDAVEIHLAAVGGKSDGLQQSGNRIVAEETRFLLIELLGYLVTFYRNMSSLRGKVGS